MHTAALGSLPQGYITSHSRWTAAKKKSNQSTLEKTKTSKNTKRNKRSSLTNENVLNIFFKIQLYCAHGGHIVRNSHTRSSHHYCTSGSNRDSNTAIRDRDVSHRGRQGTEEQRTDNWLFRLPGLQLYCEPPTNMHVPYMCMHVLGKLHACTHILMNEACRNCY